jgi:FixJ family two-component response regulator
VYRFFLKPCNPTDLISTIQQAIDHKRLEERSRELLQEFQRQGAMLDSIERHHPDSVRHRGRRSRSQRSRR